jgi:hypothetical protein
MQQSSEVDSFINICQRNLLALRQALSDLGYQFARPAGPLQPADDADRAMVADAERRFGELPFLLRRWYDTFRYVDFSQAPDQLQFGSLPVSGLGYNITLVFVELERCVRFRDELRASGIAVEREREGKSLLPLGTFASNCEPKGVWLPDHSTDPVIYDDGAGPVSLSDELRAAFQSGGFPFWDRMFRKRRFVSPLGFAPKYLELRETLRRDIIDV